MSAAPKTITITLTIPKFIVATLMNLVAVVGVGWAAASYVGAAETREWWRTEGAVAVHAMIGEGITLHEAKQALEIAAAKLEVSEAINAKLATTSEMARENALTLKTNKETLEKLERKLDYLYVKAGGR